MPTKAQDAVWKAWLALEEELERTVTIREVAESMNKSVPAVWSHMAPLVREGRMIDLGPGKGYRAKGDLNPHREEISGICQGRTLSQGLEEAL